MTKYRGLRLDGKGWVEGCYGRDCLGGHVITVYEDDFASISHYDIHPESLSISFGLSDKNGKEIFGSIDGSKGGDRYKDIADVEYNVYIVSGAACGGKSIDNCSPLGWQGEYRGIEVIQTDFCKSIEIIGNQYETQ